MSCWYDARCSVGGLSGLKIAEYPDSVSVVNPPKLGATLLTGWILARMHDEACYRWNDCAEA